MAWFVIVSRNLLIFSKRHPENSYEYSEFLYLYGNHRHRRSHGCSASVVIVKRNKSAARVACSFQFAAEHGCAFGVQGLLMCCAVLLLMVPIASLPLVFGGLRAQPIAEELQLWAHPGSPSGGSGEEVRPPPPPIVRWFHHCIVPCIRSTLSACLATCLTHLQLRTN